MRFVATACTCVILVGAAFTGPIILNHPMTENLKPSEEVVAQAEDVMRTVGRFLESAPRGFDDEDRRETS